MDRTAQHPIRSTKPEVASLERLARAAVDACIAIIVIGGEVRAI